MRLNLIVLTVTLSGLAWAQQQAPNALVNPGFEDGAGEPTGWSFNHRRTDGLISWERERARTGAASVRLSNATPAQSGNVLQTVPFDPPLPAGSRLTFSAWAAAQDVRGNGPRIILSLWSNDGVRQDAVATGSAGSHDFELVQGQVQAQRQTTRATIYLCHYDTGTVWWDDAHLSVERARPMSIMPRPQTAELLPPLRTDQGLELVLSSTGGIAGLSVRGDSHLSPLAHTGLFVVPYGGNAVPVTGEMRVENGSIVQQCHLEDLGLRVLVTYSVEGDALAGRGVVEDLTGQDRGVDVIFCLPVGGEGWRWGKSIREETPLTGEPVTQDGLTWSSVSHPENGWGIALAVPADSPCDCRFSWDAQLGHAVRYRFGLSPAAGGQFRSRAPFQFIIYACDGAWGLRDATRRYYEFYPAAFARRAQRDGLWMFGSARFELPDPQNYAFHEGGPQGWEYDEQHGICTCPYIIPGQREVRGLQSRPASRQQAWELFRAWQPGPGLPASWGADIKAIIESSLLLAADGLPQMSLRHTDWGGESITFPLNANPALFADTDAVTLARSQLAEVRAWHEATPQLDGTYVDSLGAWGDYDNFRSKHFAYTQTPLTYDQLSGRPVINNSFTLLEFLWELGRMMHAQGDLVFANGVHRDRRFHAFACDVAGVEGHADLEQKRAIAGTKPFLLLIYGIEDNPAEMERWFNECGLYGIYPAFGNLRAFATAADYAPVAALNNRYVPVLRHATEAGWQPVTHVRSSDPQVWVERWGPSASGELYLTIYNSAATERAATLAVVAQPLGLRGTVRAADELSQFAVTTPVVDGVAELLVEVPARRLMVLRLSSQ